MPSFVPAGTIFPSDRQYARFDSGQGDCEHRHILHSQPMQLSELIASVSKIKWLDAPRAGIDEKVVHLSLY